MDPKLYNCSYCGQLKRRDKFNPKDENQDVDQPSYACKAHSRKCGMAKKEFEEQMTEQNQTCVICSSKIAKKAMKMDYTDDSDVRGIFCHKFVWVNWFSVNWFCEKVPACSGLLKAI